MPGSSRRRRAPTSFTACSRSSGSAGRRRRRRRRPRPIRPPAPPSRAGRSPRRSRYLGMIGPAQRPDPVRPRAGGIARERRERSDRRPSSAAQIGRLDLGVWAAREARNQRRELLCPRRLPRSADPGRLSQPLGGRARHHPPGKLVRSRRDQLRQCARHDAAHARHRPDEARRVGVPYNLGPADRGSRLQHPARQQPSSRC